MLTPGFLESNGCGLIGGALWRPQLGTGGLVLRRSPPAVLRQCEYPRVFRTECCGSHPRHPKSAVDPARPVPHLRPPRPSPAQLVNSTFLSMTRPTLGRRSVNLAVSHHRCHMPPHAQAGPDRPVSPHGYLTAVVKSEAPSLQEKRRALCSISGDVCCASARNSGLIYELPRAVPPTHVLLHYQSITPLQEYNRLVECAWTPG